MPSLRAKHLTTPGSSALRSSATASARRWPSCWRSCIPSESPVLVLVAPSANTDSLYRLDRLLAQPVPGVPGGRRGAGHDRAATRRAAGAQATGRALVARRALPGRRRPVAADARDVARVRLRPASAGIRAARARSAIGRDLALRRRSSPAARTGWFRSPPRAGSPPRSATPSSWCSSAPLTCCPSNTPTASRT